MKANNIQTPFDENKYLQDIKKRYERMFPCVTFRDYVRCRLNHFKRERVTGIKRRYGGHQPPPY